MMRTFCFLLAISLVCSAPVLFAQAKSDFPRGPDGKPDLTGVWQGGSTIRGSWDEANGGLGAGGSGRNPHAPATPSSNDRPTGPDAATYHAWTGKKVREPVNKRASGEPP